jgi:hypothetical protein
MTTATTAPTTTATIVVAQEDDDTFWDAAVNDVLLGRGGGICTIPLVPNEMWWQLAQTAFGATRQVLKCMDRQQQQQQQQEHSTVCSSFVNNISNHADSAHVTGYHPAAAAVATTNAAAAAAAAGENNNNINNNKSLSSRYNAHRRGFVFSDCDSVNVNDIFNNITITHNNKNSRKEEGGSSSAISTSATTSHAHQHTTAHDHFAATTATACWTRLYQQVLHVILENMLLALERKLQLPVGYFQDTLGPTISNSQWHVKEYITSNTTVPTTTNTTTTTNDKIGDNDTDDSHDDDDDDDILELLPTHTDPSILSVVIHDQENGACGAQGLQYAVYDKHTKTTTWHDVVVPKSDNDPPQDGHDRGNDTTAVTMPFFAVVLVGSVLPILTGGRIPACRHRVIHHHHASSNTTPATTTTTTSTRSRMAATLFGRPAPTALLQLLPLHSLDLLDGNDDDEALFKTTRKNNNSSEQLRHCRTKEQQRAKKTLTFEAWNQKVARNYEKAKSRNSSTM